MGPYAWEAATTQSRTRRAKGEQSVRSKGALDERALQRTYKSQKTCHTTSPNLQGQEYLLYDDIRDLDRSAEVFLAIAEDPYLVLSLPPPGVTAGRVIEHATSTFESYYAKLSPMTFKFGYSHDPPKRWNNARYGYKHTEFKFEKMIILFAAGNHHGPAFLEAALIKQFGSTMAAIPTAEWKVTL